MALTNNDLPKLVELLDLIDIRMKQRGRTAVDWAAGNEVLKAREFGMETDTGRAKIGDGVTAWDDLRYWHGMPVMSGSTPAAGQVLAYDDTTHELRWIDPGKTYQSGAGIDISDPDSAAPTINCTLGSIALDGRVSDYAALPTGLGANDAGAAYLVDADGLVYVWNGSAWPAEGAGIDASGTSMSEISRVRAIPPVMTAWQRIQQGSKTYLIPAYEMADSPPGASDLIGSYRCGAVTNDIIADESGHGHDLTVNQGTVGPHGGRDDVLVFDGNGSGATSEAFGTPFQLGCFACLVYIDRGIVTTGGVEMIGCFVTDNKTQQAGFVNHSTSSYVSSNAAGLCIEQKPDDLNGYGRTYRRDRHATAWYRLIFNWNKVAARWDIYINGQSSLQYSGTDSLGYARVIDYAKVISIGYDRGQGPTVSNLVGAYDRVLVYGTGKTAAEVAAIDLYLATR